MPRIRMIKPEFFDDPAIADLSPFARLFFIGLWLNADREGCLEDNMRRLKAKIFPYDDVDCESLAGELHGKDMIRRYPAVEKHGWIRIKNFLKHQRPHPKEPPSLSPPLDPNGGRKLDPATTLPCKKTAGSSESGVLSLDNGILNTESGVLSLDPLSSRIVEKHGANGNRHGKVEAVDLQVEQFQAAYPAHRRQADFMTVQMLCVAIQTEGLDTLLTALEQHKRSEQWQTPKTVSNMKLWLSEKRWKQILPEPAPFGSTPKTEKNLPSLRGFVGRRS